METPVPTFDKNLEEFYSICDQIELHMVHFVKKCLCIHIIASEFQFQKTSIKCLSQAESSNRYLHLPVAPTRSESLGINDNTLTYPQYLSTASSQVAYAKEIHDTLIAAAQNISPSD